MLPDLRKIEPELLEDDIECALQDSMDVNWTCSTGAHAIMRMLFAIATEAHASGNDERLKALKLIADDNSWRGFSPLAMVDRMRETARAAIACVEKSA